MMARDAVLKRQTRAGYFRSRPEKNPRRRLAIRKENADFPYYFLRDWLGGAEGKSSRPSAQRRQDSQSRGKKRSRLIGDAKGSVTPVFRRFEPT